MLIAEEGPYNSNADVALVKSGELLIVYNTGRSHAAVDQKIQLRRSSDQGRTWGEPRTIVPPINKGAGVRDPHIVQLADGRLLLSYFSHPEYPQLRGIQTWVIASADEGKTWDAPLLVGPPGPQGNLEDWLATSGKILQLDDKTLLLPLYGNLECGVARSDDGGKTWPRFITVLRSPSYEGFEAEIVRTGSRELVCLIRRSYKPSGYRAVSQDLGVAWGPPEDVTVGHAPGLLLEDNWLLVNHRADPERMGKPLPKGMGTVLSLSLDHGKTFVSNVLLDRIGAGGDCAYGGIVKLRPGAPAPYFTSYYSTPGAYPKLPGKPGRRCSVYGRFFRVVP